MHLYIEIKMSNFVIVGHTDTRIGQVSLFWKMEHSCCIGRKNKQITEAFNEFNEQAKEMVNNKKNRHSQEKNCHKITCILKEIQHFKSGRKCSTDPAFLAVNYHGSVNPGLGRTVRSKLEIQAPRIPNFSIKTTQGQAGMVLKVTTGLEFQAK